MSIVVLATRAARSDAHIATTGRIRAAHELRPMAVLTLGAEVLGTFGALRHRVLVATG